MSSIATHELQDRIVEFLRGIGISIREEAIAADTFLPGIAVENGELILDRARNTWPGDLLHEAGHLAVLPDALRRTVGGNLHGTELVLHAGEPEVTAWAYAALVEIGLPSEVLFHEGGYGGKSAGLCFTYSLGVYPGAAGLSAAGMAAIPAQANAASAKVYPAMLRWLRAA
ncbi:hypothetical protein [Caenimonas koreensis]|uniref:hypothetical protein n=1 Tax=Caenimonas koreensis TaxID=367474 RepID=UPI0037851902